MKRQYRVYGGQIPENLVKGMIADVYSVNVRLRDSSVEYGNLDLPTNIIQNKFELMRKNALDKVIDFYSGNLTVENKFSTDGNFELSDLEGRCLGVIFPSLPKISQKTLWLANFGVRSDSLHYIEKGISGSNQTPKGSINIEFIGYSSKN